MKIFYHRLCVACALFLYMGQLAAAQSSLNNAVSITPAKLTVRELFNQLTQKAGLNFVYGNIDRELDQPLELNPASAPVRNILEQVARKTALTLTANGSDVAVKLQARGSLTGKVTTSDGEPARQVTITIEGLRSTSVGASGHYVFKHVPAGKYTVTATFVGLETQRKTVSVTEGANTVLDLVLSESRQDLKEVVISGAKTNKYARKESEYVARIPIQNLENPQVYNVVRKELMTTQLTTTLDEAYRNIPGVVVSRSGAGIPAVTARGFLSGDNLRNGMATFLKTGIDPVTVERVEAIKGPSSTLFGSTMVSFGGLVNYVIKRPYDSFGGEVSYTQGSFDLSRLTADVNVPLNEDKTLLFRITAAQHKENSFQDQGFQHLTAVSPSLTYQVNDRLKLTIDADVTKVNGTSAILLTIPTTLFNGKSFKDLPIDYKQSLIDNSLASIQQSTNVFAQAEYRISENWRSQTNYAYSLGSYDQFNQFNYAWTSATTIARRISMFNPDRWGRKQIQQNFIGDFKVAGLRNRLLVGLDYTYQYRRLKYGVVSLDVADLTKPIAGISIAQANNAFAALNTPETDSQQDTYSSYVSDVVNVTDRLLAMLSLRIDRFVNGGTLSTATNQVTGNYKQTAYSPKFGLVYQPVKDQVSIFANFLNGFKNVQNATQPDGTVTIFKPQEARQLEGGVKLDLFDKKLNATISYYQINVQHSIYTEIRGGQTYTVQDGTQLSKGVDFELIANPVPGLNIITGYGYNDNRFTKAAAAVEGKRATLTPANMANVWIGYALPEGRYKGLGAGIGGNYVSDSFFANTRINNNTEDYTFILPGYTFIDAALFYEQQKFRLSLKANNIGNVHAWAIDGRPQKPLNFLTAITYKF